MGQNGIGKHNFCNFFKNNLVPKNIFVILLLNENQNFFIYRIYLGGGGNVYHNADSFRDTDERITWSFHARNGSLTITVADLEAK